MTKIRITVGIICIIGIALLAWSTASSLGKVDYNALGKAEYEKGNYEKAIEYFTSAIEKDPTNADAYWNRGNTYATEDVFFHHYFKLPGQRTYAEAGHPEMDEAFQKAVSDFRKAMELDPGYAPLSHLGLGNAYYLYYDYYDDMLNKAVLEYENALQGLDQIKAKLGEEGVAMVYTNLARTYLKMCELDKAYGNYKKAIEISPIDTALEHLVPVCIELGKYEEAYEVASRYIEMSREAGSEELDLALMPGAVAAYHLGKYDEALDYINEVIDTFPESAYVAEAYRFRAMIRRQEGREVEARKDLEEAIRICSDIISNPEVPADIPGAYYERGLCYFDLEEYKKALRDFRYLVEHPEIADREVAHENYYIEGYVALACTYSQLGRNEEARGTFEEALEKLDTDPELKGWRKYIRDDVKELLKRVERGEVVPIPLMYEVLGK